MNHTSDEHPWFVASRRREAPYTDWYLWRDSPGARPRRVGRARPTTGCRGSAGRAGRSTRCAASGSTTRSWSSSPSSTGACPRSRPPSGRWSGAGWSVASTASGWTPSTSSSSTPSCPPTRARAAPRRGPASATSTTSTSPTCPTLHRSLPGGRRRLSGADVGGRAVRGHDRGRGRADRRPPPRVRLGAHHPALVGGGVPGRPAPPRAGLRRRALADDRAVQPRPAPPRVAPGRVGRGERTGSRRHRPRRRAAEPDRARHAVPVLRRGAGHGRRRRPARREHRRAGEARVSPDFPWWDRSRCRTPMPWTAEPGAGFTSGRPWLRFGPDVATRNVATEAADPGVGAGRLPAAHRRPTSAAGPPGRARCASSGRRPGRAGLSPAGARSGRRRRARRRSPSRPTAAASRLPAPGGAGARWRPVVATTVDAARRSRPATARSDWRGYQGVVLVAESP